MSNHTAAIGIHVIKSELLFVKTDKILICPNFVYFFDTKFIQNIRTEFMSRQAEGIPRSEQLGWTAGFSNINDKPTKLVREEYNGRVKADESE